MSHDDITCVLRKDKSIGCFRGQLNDICRLLVDLNLIQSISNFIILFKMF